MPETTDVQFWIMPVHVGIVCRKCAKVYFLATSPERIELDNSLTKLGLYRLTCVSPCDTIRSFHQGDMRPYSVSMYSYERGFANWGEYQELRRVG